MKARDIMTMHEVCACSDTSDTRRVAEMMQEHNIGSIAILDGEGRLEGIVTDRDICCRLVAQGKPGETPVSEIMSTAVKTVTAETGLSEIESLMSQYRIRRLPVVDNQNRLQGWISLGDLARHCHGIFKEHHVAEVLEAVSTPV